MDRKKIKGPWTQFDVRMDMHSGGDSKTQWQFIYIQAPEEVAEVVFYNRFGHNPYDVACQCCGSNYSITESKDLLQVTGYHRNCHWDGKKYIEAARKERWYQEAGTKHTPIETFLRDPTLLFIFASDIKDTERTGALPEVDDGYDDEQD